MPLPGSLLVKKRFKHAGLSFAVHSNAVIADDQNYVLARLNAIAPARVRCSDLCIAGLDEQFAAFWHRVARIDGKVHDELLNLPRIGFHRPQPRRGRYVQSNIFFDEAVEHFRHFSQDAVQVHDSGLEHLFAAEGKQAAGEAGRAGYGVFNSLRILLARRRREAPRGGARCEPE